MVLETKLASLQNIKISRVVIVSGMLTFLYLIEFAIGIRTIHFAFGRWSNSSKHTQAISLGLCVSSLLLFTTSSFFINVMSALWEQKQMKEGGKDKSVLRFTLHAIVGGMIWRYVCLWFCSSKEQQKKEAALLTMVKFLFTQICTIPMVIVHVSLLESLDELVYDVTSVFGISVNLMLTCVVFSWCKKEILELKKWNFETVDLVPLVFCQNAEVTGETVKEDNDWAAKDTEKGKGDTSEQDEDGLETMILRTIVFLQTFSFSLGRLLALGILLKTAGIYSVSIMFLQLLISVVYLKFQVPFLVSDSLPKWRQLTRFVFMGYILIFEWQLNRNPKTGYDFTSNVKHSMAYYFIATLESIFYYVTWFITYNYSTNGVFETVNSPNIKFVRNIIVIGSLCLLFSLAAHIMLMFWQSSRMASLMHSVSRRYLSSKLKFSYTGSKDRMKDDKSSESRPKVDISNPIAKCNEDSVWKQDSLDDDGQLTHHNSYKDLREPVDDEIEIYVRKFRSEDALNINKTKKENVQNASNYATANAGANGFPEQHHLNLESNRVGVLNTRETMNDKSREIDKNARQSKYPEDIPEPMLKKSHKFKSKVSIISETVNEKWNKFSSISKGFTETLRDHIQKRKEQVLNLRTTAKDSDTGERSNENIQKQDKKIKFNPTGKDNIRELQRKENNGNLISYDNVPKRNEPFHNLNSIVTVKGKPQNQENHCSAIFSKDKSVNPRNCVRQDVVMVPKDDKASTDFIVGKLLCAEEAVESSEHMETSVADPETDDISADEYSPVNNLNEKGIESCCNNDEQGSCFDCDDGVEHQFLRRRSLSVPLPDRKLRQNFLKTMVATDVSEDSTINHCPPSPKTSSVEVELENSSSSQNYIPPMVAVHSGLKRLSLLPVDDRKEHFV